MIQRIKRQLRPIRTAWARVAQNRISMLRNASRVERRLEIGSSAARIPGFESLNIIPSRHVDYVLDCTRRLPFRSGTFSIIYASHVIEHLPWYSAAEVLREWSRILKRGGKLEVWVPDALKVCETVVAAESGYIAELPDGWQMRNPSGDIYLWANGRLFYGANQGYPSWHTAMYTPKSLVKLLEGVGLTQVRVLPESENSGPDLHGWINLGACGTKA